MSQSLSKYNLIEEITLFKIKWFHFTSNDEHLWFYLIELKELCGCCYIVIIIIITRYIYIYIPVFPHKIMGQ